jgi:hypothetical protein
VYLFQQYHPTIQYHYTYNGKNDFSHNIEGRYGPFVGLQILSKTPAKEVSSKETPYDSFSSINYEGSFYNSAIARPKYCFCIREMK